MIVELKPYTPLIVIDGEHIPLTPTEHAFLRLLVDHEGELVTRARLYQDVWAHALDVSPRKSRTIDSTVCRLRRKLGDRLHIVGSPRVGYGLVPVADVVDT